MDVVRVVTLNLWNEQPPLERRMALAVDGLRALDADVVCLQEVRDAPGALANQAETIARALGLECAFAPASQWGGGDEGVAILSRRPILRRQSIELPYPERERRVCLGAGIDTPHGELAVFTTHLHWRVVDGTKREAQVVAIDGFAATWPTRLPRILCGDFNAAPSFDEIRFLRGETTLAGRRAHWQDAWLRAGPESDSGHTWSRRNPYTQRMRFVDIDRRIDYIFVGGVEKDGRGLVRSARLCLDIPDSDGHFPSDHFAVCAEVQLAPLAPSSF